MKSCRQCGQVNDDLAQFCENCGKRFEDSTHSVGPTASSNEEGPRTRMDRYRQEPKQATNTSRPFTWTWQRLLGFSLILASLILLGGHYWMNDSKAMVSRHFTKAMQRGDLTGAARMVSTPLGQGVWTEQELIHCLENYQAAGVDLTEDLSKKGWENGLYAGDHLLVSLDQLGSFFFLPQYRVIFHPIQVDLASPNNLKIINLEAKGQVDQAVTDDRSLQISPSVREVTLTIRYQGLQEEVVLPLNYQQLNQGHYPLAVYPTENRLVIDQTKLGLRTNFSFSIRSMNVDGQTYFQDEVILAGYTGQSFQVAFTGEYNQQVIQSQPLVVTLTRDDQQVLDFSSDQTLRDQIIQAEK